MRRAHPFIPCLLLVASVACTGTSSTEVPTPSVAPAGSSATPGVDPLVPYSPPPTPHTERTSGFIPDTLTLPANGGTTVALTPVTTSMTLTFVHEARAFVVYLDVENPGTSAWSGIVGADAQVTDASGGVFPAEPARRGDLHPDPGRYGASNRNLLRSITVKPGKNV